jgi:hypothetical protein
MKKRKKSGEQKGSTQLATLAGKMQFNMSGQWSTGTRGPSRATGGGGGMQQALGLSKERLSSGLRQSFAAKLAPLVMLWE